jgi:hypothetical protein
MQRLQIKKINRPTRVIVLLSALLLVSIGAYFWASQPRHSTPKPPPQLKELDVTTVDPAKSTEFDIHNHYQK